MELLVTLKKIEYLKKLKEFGVKGVICGTPVFSSRFFFNLEELKQIKQECVNNGLDLYVSIDTMIEEKDRLLLIEYLDFLKKLDVDGIYFSDLAVYSVAKDFGLEDLLIYDPTTLMTNSLDANFYLSLGISSVVLAREITLEEILNIAKRTDNRVEMQIFGYLKTATSKRRFLSNYFKHLGQTYDVTDKESLRIVEETRDYEMPILENKYGTQIFTDYILNTYIEYPVLSKVLKRGIIDDIFLSEAELFDVLRDYSSLNEDNASLLLNNLKLKYYDRSFDTGYLYQKTNTTK